ncbi:hypothetical protein HDU79_009939 [Rhizoclosmatium sp. JEL0117]|nr:hypothetical protein HDU79_009939 [Rhizoclosmatium sp. JEL0117]
MAQDKPLTLEELDEAITTPTKRQAIGNKLGFDDNATLQFIDMNRSYILAENAKKAHLEEENERKLQDKALMAHKTLSTLLLKARVDFMDLADEGRAQEAAAKKKEIDSLQERLSMAAKSLPPSHNTPNAKVKDQDTTEPKERPKFLKLPANAPQYKRASASVVDILRHGDECSKMLKLYSNEKGHQLAGLLAQTIDSSTHRRIGDHDNADSLTSALLEESIGKDFRTEMKQRLSPLLSLPPNATTEEIKDLHSTLELAVNYMPDHHFEDLYIQVLPTRLHPMAMSEKANIMHVRFKAVEEYHRKLSAAHSTTTQQPRAYGQLQVRETPRVYIPIADQCTLHPTVPHTNQDCNAQKRARDAATRRQTAEKPTRPKCGYCLELRAKGDERPNPNHDEDVCFRKHPHLRTERQIALKNCSIHIELDDVENDDNETDDIIDGFLNGI